MAMIKIIRNNKQIGKALKQSILSAINLNYRDSNFSLYQLPRSLGLTEKSLYIYSAIHSYAQTYKVQLFCPVTLLFVSSK